EYLRGRFKAGRIAQYIAAPAEAAARKPAHGDGVLAPPLDPAASQCVRNVIGVRGACAASQEQRRQHPHHATAGKSPAPSSSTGPVISTRSSPARHSMWSVPPSASTSTERPV